MERCAGALTNDTSAGVQALTPGLKQELYSKVGSCWEAGWAAARMQDGVGGRWGGVHMFKVALSSRAPHASPSSLTKHPFAHPPPTQVAEYGGGSALRVLALAYRPWSSDRLDVSPADESELVFVGLVGMQVRALMGPGGVVVHAWLGLGGASTLVGVQAHWLGLGGGCRHTGEHAGTLVGACGVPVSVLMGACGDGGACMGGTWWRCRCVPLSVQLIILCSHFLCCYGMVPRPLPAATDARLAVWRRRGRQWNTLCASAASSAHQLPRLLPTMLCLLCRTRRAWRCTRR